MTATTRIMAPGQIEAPAGQIPFLGLPDAKTLFARRAERFLALSQGHSMEGLLALLGNLALAQQRLLDAFPPVALPSLGHLAMAHEHGMPPLSVHTWQRDPVWREGLAFLVRRLQQADIPVGTKSVLERFPLNDDAQLERQAALLLGGDYHGLDPAMTPFLGAALQTYWVSMASTMWEQTFVRIASPFLCPVCGSRPVASVVHDGAEKAGLRYLHCALCAAEWHMVRVKCSSCESTKGIAYYEVEGGKGAIKAENCDACDSYLKILY